MNRINSGIIVAVLAVGLSAPAASGQGTFQNLDFELATVGSDPTARAVSFTSGFPGWTGYYDNAAMAGTALYNTVFIGSSGFSHLDANGTPPIIISHYTAVLQAGNPSLQPDVSLAQTGLIPAGTMSLRFLAIDDFRGGMITATMGNRSIRSCYKQLAHIVNTEQMFPRSQDKRRSCDSRVRHFPKDPNWPLIISLSPQSASPNRAPGPCSPSAARCSGAHLAAAGNSFANAWSARRHALRTLRSGNWQLYT